MSQMDYYYHLFHHLFRINIYLFCILLLIINSNQVKQENK